MSQSEVPQLLTTKKLWAAFFVQLNEAYQITVLLPMVVFMCRDFGISPHFLGIYTSLLNASFMFCQFLVSYFWGSFSDKYGRRLALLIGLIGSTFGIVAFGFAQSYPHALIARCICGLSNGNLGVIKAWLSDITNSNNRGFAFSMLSISFGFGNVLGSMIGGLLIRTSDVDLPSDQYTPTVSIINFSIFHRDFPFLAPCLVGAIVSANSVFWTLYQVKNENQPSQRSRIDSFEASMGYTNAKENESDLVSIVDHEPTNAKTDFDIAFFDIRFLNLYQNRGTRSLPMFTDNLFISDNKQKRPLLETNEEEFHSLAELFRQTDLFVALVAYVVVAISHLMYQEMGPVYMAQALKFDSQSIGFVQAWSGVNWLVFTFCFQPFFLRRFQYRNMGVFTALMLAIVMILMPSIYWTVFASVTNQRWIQIVAACACESLMVWLVSILFVLVVCFINNSVPPRHCGKANGVAQAFAALGRAIGPMITGFIWSESVQYLRTAQYAVYWGYTPSFVGFIACAVHIYLFIKPKYQFTWEMQMEMKVKRLLELGISQKAS